MNKMNKKVSKKSPTKKVVKTPEVKKQKKPTTKPAAKKQTKKVAVPKKEDVVAHLNKLKTTLGKMKIDAQVIIEEIDKKTTAVDEMLKDIAGPTTTPSQTFINVCSPINSNPFANVVGVQ